MPTVKLGDGAHVSLAFYILILFDQVARSSHGVGSWRNAVLYLGLVCSMINDILNSQPLVWS